MIQTRALLLALLALAPAAHAADNARCMEVYNAELARITREAEAAARGRPAPRDLEAQRQILIPIERAMREAADKADKCERGNRDHSKDEATTMNIRARADGYMPSEAVAADIIRILQLWAEARARFGKGGPFLFGAFSIADAMYAPVVLRFRTYEVELPADCRAYSDAVLALPAMQDWIAAAMAETESLPQFELYG